MSEDFFAQEAVEGRTAYKRALRKVRSVKKVVEELAAESGIVYRNLKFTTPFEDG